MYKNQPHCYVVVYTSTVAVHLLTEKADYWFRERVRIVGEDKANKFQFGPDAINALPTSAACMEFIALQLPEQCERDRMLKAFCACILLGKPLPNNSNDADGGLKVMADSDKPKPKKPSDGAAVALSAKKNRAINEAIGAN